MIGTYLIRCTKTNFRYVGSSQVSVENRFSWHRSALRGDYHPNENLQADWNKFGEKYFQFNILKICLKKQVLDLEQKALDYWDSRNLLYNILPFSHSALGVQRTSAQRKLQSQRAKERCTPEWRAAVSERVKAQHAARKFGHATWKPENKEKTYQKISQSLKGHLPAFDKNSVTPEFRKHCSEAALKREAKKRREHGN